jgi:hypothetical protein
MYQLSRCGFGAFILAVSDLVPPSQMQASPTNADNKIAFRSKIGDVTLKIRTKKVIDRLPFSVTVPVNAGNGSRSPLGGA